MRTLDDIQTLFNTEDKERYQHIIVDVLIVESHAISNLKVKDEIVLSFDLQDYTRSVTYRVSFDQKSVTLNSSAQYTVQGSSYSHTLNLITANSHAKPSTLATRANQNKFYVFYKTSEDKWYILPTYGGAELRVSYDKFPSKATLRFSSQSKESQMEVDEELLEFLNPSFRLPEGPIIVAL